MIIVIGQYHSNLIDCLDASGLPYLIIKDAKRYDDPEAVSFDDPSSVISAIHACTDKPSVVVAMYEQYIPLAAYINEHFKISHALSDHAAINATDKVHMRQAFTTVPGISPQFKEISSADEAVMFAKENGYPVIIKPANLSKSMLIRRCDDDEDIRDMFSTIDSSAATLYKKYTNNQPPKFIIEQFMTGSLHTVAAFIDFMGRISVASGIVDNVSARSAGYDDEFILQRTIPSQLSDEQQKEVIQCAIKSITALGLRSCPAHVEIMMTSDGAKVIEIGARLGGYRPVMYSLSQGQDLLEAAIQSYLGKPTQLKRPKVAFTTSVIELFPRSTGTLRRLSGLNEIERLATLAKFRVQSKIGTRVGPSSEGYKAIAYAVLSGSDAAAVERDSFTLLQSFGYDMTD